MRPRVRELVAGGLGTFDALHLAWAEYLRTDAFLTTNDRLIRRGLNLARPPLRLLNPVDFIKELPQ